ncbi:MAG: superoxide dismutase, Ni [Candidatus Eisenbacteria bacterium]|nr:superoxide dismutase, Ni [Candidatus Latescibacterota bacterium]MBD3300923.1 superoxide dismutase, Ni [Candidatus Eisenbacteria bacterium]
MVHRMLTKLDERIGFERARAHCDIPCGIYDPIMAQIPALTVVRMIDLMTEFAADHKDKDLEYHNTMSRYIEVKEEHAERVKHEVRVIWGDYIKPHHVEKHPEVHGITHKIMQLGSKCRQTADREAAVQLVAAVNEFAELFWKTKEVATKRAKAPYAPGLELVYPAL